MNASSILIILADLQGDYDSRGALHLAAADGKLLAVAYLLSVSANPNVMDRWKRTALEDALAGRHFHSAKLLQANGGVVGENPSKEVLENLEYLEANYTFDDARELVADMLSRVSSSTPGVQLKFCSFTIVCLTLSIAVLV